MTEWMMEGQREEIEGLLPKSVLIVASDETRAQTIWAGHVSVGWVVSTLRSLADSIEKGHEDMALRKHGEGEVLPEDQQKTASATGLSEEARQEILAEGDEGHGGASGDG